MKLKILKPAMNTSSQKYRREIRFPRISIWLVHAVSLGALVLVATGCLSRPALVRQAFALENPSLTGVPAKKGEGVLAIRSCDVSPLFEGRAFVYRIGAEAYEVDPYAGFLIPPARALAIPLRASLRGSGIFRDVAEPGSLLQPDRLLEVHVAELYGDFRPLAAPAAVLSMRFLFFRVEKGLPPVVWFERNYSRRMALPENSAGSLIGGWNKALAEIMNEVVADLTAAPSP